jgi:CMP-2-keto-3-deoxyoctulosonic acid synthetase
MICAPSSRNFVAIVASALLAGLVATSCTRTKSPESILHIDSLIVVCDSTGMLLNQVDTNKVILSRKRFAEYWSQIRSSIDSMEHAEEIKGDEFWNYITLYEANDRSLKKLIRRYNNLKSRYLENKNQLLTLRASVNKNQIPEDSLVYYIFTEGVAVAETQHEADLYVPELLKTVHVLDSLHPYAPEAVAHYQKIGSKTKKNQ